MAVKKKYIFYANIGNRKWSIRFMPKELMQEDNYGTCWTLKRAIDIQNCLDRGEAEIVLAHELTHAFLAVAGKLHVEDFSEENVCDFVAWNIDNIIQIRDEIISKRFDN